jgi:protein-S-isoprenylcysteine O-methyltransferase Ste14
MLIFTLKLLIAHFIGDFALQPLKWVKHKAKHKHKSKYLYVHIFIHLLLLLLVLEFDFNLWPYILLIVISHLIIDILKLNLQNKKNARMLFFLDQLMHLLVIALAVYLVHPFDVDLSIIFSKQVLLTLLALIILIPVSSIIMLTVMSKWQLSETPKEDGLRKAGAYIGVLERLFIFLFVVLGQWAGIGFLITAKSVFRFGDLSRAKDRKLTEYILIGSLFSFLLAVLTGLAYSYLIK